MNKNRIENIIPKAIAEISASGTGIADASRNVERQFKGYISSFGASIVQSGILATVIFFENDTSTEAPRSKVPVAILKLLNSDSFLTEPDKAKLAGKNKLSKFLLEYNGNIPNHVKQAVMDNAIALKMGLRTFNIK